jgi:hypothetical protein
MEDESTFPSGMSLMTWFRLPCPANSAHVFYIGYFVDFQIVKWLSPDARGGLSSGVSTLKTVVDNLYLLINLIVHTCMHDGRQNLEVDTIERWDSLKINENRVDVCFWRKLQKVVKWWSNVTAIPDGGTAENQDCLKTAQKASDN